MQSELRSRSRFREHKAARLLRESLPGALATAAALILLSGSQAGFALGQLPHPGATAASPVPSQQTAGGAEPPVPPTGTSIDGGSPPLGGIATPPSSKTSPSSAPTGSPSAAASPQIVGGGPIPSMVLTAYLDAQQRLADSEPGCNLPWQLLAAIGQVESGQAEGGNLTSDGTARTPILGPPLDGKGFDAIRTSDGSWARAEGPMQFIPSTWAVWGTDGNGDGKADPENIFDATLSAADYLCSGGGDLSNSADLNAAILGYNPTQNYKAYVLAWMAFYQHNGAQPGPDAALPTPNVSSASHDPTGSASPTPSNSPSPHPSSSPDPSPAQSTPTPKPSPTSAKPTPQPTSAAPTPTAEPTSPSPTPTHKPSPTASPSPTGSPTPSASPSPTCPATSPSPTPSSAPTGTPTATPTSEPSATPSKTPSPTASPTPSDSPTATCN